MNFTYLDNSATTRASKGVADKVYSMLVDNFGNPSSLHSVGYTAEKEVEKAREIVAKSLFCDKSEIFFTSGGTEGNNLAILGTVEAKKRLGNRVVVSTIEHSSVIDSFKYLEKQGYEVVWLSPNNQGVITKEQLEEAINEKTILISVQYINNEIGSIQPIELIKPIVKRKKSPALVHSDCVQAFGKIAINPKKLGVDLVTVSAHKIHGPKGVGAIYISKDCRIMPRAFGGEQQKKIRPGTESTPLIAGFGVAIEELLPLKQSQAIVKELNDYCKAELTKIEGVQINSPQNASDYIINLSASRVKSETMLHYLASKNVFISTGSACAKGKKSHVLTSLALSDSAINSAIRVSFSVDSTKEEIDHFILNLKEGIDSLVKK